MIEVVIIVIFKKSTEVWKHTCKWEIKYLCERIIYDLGMLIFRKVKI